MRNSSTEEEKDMVGSVLCKQLYQMWECKFLPNFVNTRESDAQDSCVGLEIDKSGGEGYDSGDWEKLAPTNSGCVIWSQTLRRTNGTFQSTGNRDV